MSNIRSTTERLRDDEEEKRWGLELKKEVGETLETFEALTRAKDLMEQELLVLKKKIWNYENDEFVRRLQLSGNGRAMRALADVIHALSLRVRIVDPDSIDFLTRVAAAMVDQGFPLPPSLQDLLPVVVQRPSTPSPLHGRTCADTD